MVVCFSRSFGTPLICPPNMDFIAQKITSPWQVVTKYKIFSENYCNIRDDYANVNNCVREKEIYVSP